MNNRKRLSALGIAVVFLVFPMVLFWAAGMGDAAQTPSIQITILPADAVTQGATWSIISPVSSGPHASGETVVVDGHTQYTVRIDCPGYQPPAENPFPVYVQNKLVSKEITLIKSTTPPVTISDITLWPTWPVRGTTSAVWEPSSFLSIGRDVVAWVTFERLASNENFFKANLSVMVKVSDTSFPPVDIDFDYGSQVFKMIPQNQFLDFPTSYTSALAGYLQSKSVLKGYSANWMTNNAVSYPNQNFSNSQTWFNMGEWNDFLKGNAGFELADSGHAPPLLMWEEDAWLTFYVDKNSAPAAWAGKTFLFLPTNQGMLYAFDVAEGSTAGAKRVWSVMPAPAFKQAPYHQARKNYDGYYSRMTVLDGPITVHDAQDSSNTWKRLLVGTTGLGTKQENKLPGTWLKEQSPVSPSGAPEVTDPGRVFGIYAIDVTDPYAPTSLWSVTNQACTRNLNSSFSNVVIENATGGSISGTDYQNLFYSVSKPLIGFTQDASGNRVWHLLVVGIDKSNHYHWYDINPMTGEVYRNGTFVSRDGSIMTLPDEATYGFNFEEWYPSRILSAYPQAGGLPVLSDVYVYLSNGTFFQWNLNTSTDNTPQHLLSIYTNESHEYPAPPITDFDIAYIGGHRYLAATAPLNYPGASPHDTYGLLIVDLDRAPVELNTQGAQGQGGDTKIRLMETGVAMVQLQTGTGSHAYDFNDIAASPLFVNNILYEALYSPEGHLSRLYTLDMGYISGITKDHGNTFLPDDAYIDDTENIFAAMTIDSEGNLLVLDEEGNIVYRVDKVLDYASGGSGPGGSGSWKMDVVYWKTS